MVFYEGGARYPRVNTILQVSEVDDGMIQKVNADNVTQILNSPNLLLLLELNDTLLHQFCLRN